MALVCVNECQMLSVGFKFQLKKRFHFHVVYFDIILRLVTYLFKSCNMPQYVCLSVVWVSSIVKVLLSQFYVYFCIFNTISC